MKAENNKILKEKKNWILLLFKKLAKLIFNRIFYVAVAMLVQLGWILMMVLRLAAYSRYIDIGLRLIGIVLVLWILNKEINPSYKLAWTMLILILPILGVVLYFSAIIGYRVFVIPPKSSTSSITSFIASLK